MAVESSLVREGIMLTKKALIIIVLTVALLLLVVYAIGHRQSVGSKDSSKTSEQSTGESEAIRYEQELSKIVDLPQGKTPTFSTVDDAQKLAAKSPTLFKNAQNGDIFLVYLNEDKTGKVVLYRPSTKKVILFIDGVDLGQQTTGTNSQKQ